jgi:hypothetical protein
MQMFATPLDGLSNPLWDLAQCGDVEGVEHLLNDFSKNGKNVYGVRCAAAIAATNGHIEVLKRLFQWMEKFDSPLSKDPLVKASLGGEEEVVIYLLNYGIPPDWSAIEQAHRKGHSSIVTLLLDRRNAMGEESADAACKFWESRFCSS